ncbi:MAG: uncharacterized protein A8A55_2251 [Amphiamblys sp. WSBS2006]|nr:MAG: uncharacterized protein A8A55_2251 [Amphiamblys sp. WSBS2006]
MKGIKSSKKKKNMIIAGIVGVFVLGGCVWLFAGMYGKLKQKQALGAFYSTWQGAGKEQSGVCSVSPKTDIDAMASQAAVEVKKDADVVFKREEEKPRGKDPVKILEKEREEKVKSTVSEYNTRIKNAVKGDRNPLEEEKKERLREIQENHTRFVENIKKNKAKELEKAERRKEKTARRNIFGGFVFEDDESKARGKTDSIIRVLFALSEVEDGIKRDIEEIEKVVSAVGTGSGIEVVKTVYKILGVTKAIADVVEKGSESPVEKGILLAEIPFMYELFLKSNDCFEGKNEKEKSESKEKSLQSLLSSRTAVNAAIIGEIMKLLPVRSTGWVWRRQYPYPSQRESKKLLEGEMKKTFGEIKKKINLLKEIVIPEKSATNEEKTIKDGRLYLWGAVDSEKVKAIIEARDKLNEALGDCEKEVEEVVAQVEIIEIGSQVDADKKIKIKKAVVAFDEKACSLRKALGEMITEINTPLKL